MTKVEQEKQEVTLKESTYQIPQYSAGGYRCDCCHEFAVYPICRANDEPDGALCECCGARY